MRVATPLVAIVLTLALVVSGAARDERAGELPSKPPGVPTIRAVSGRQALDCTGAIVPVWGETAQGSNEGAATNADLYNCAPAWEETGGEVVYLLDLPAPDHWIVDVDIEDAAYCDLDVFLLASCDENDCLDYSGGHLVTTPVEPGVYYLVVDGYDGAECEYTIMVDAVAAGAPVESCCPILEECAVFDFNASDCGFFTHNCGGAPTWGWGELPGPISDCDDETATSGLATGVGSTAYPPNAGEAAVIGPVNVTADCTCLEVCHTYFIEEEFDGGNVKVSDDGGSNWHIVYPSRMYDGITALTVSGIPGEAAFSYEGSPVYRDCFDISDYVGSEILIGFFFGSDSVRQYPGWYILSARVGTDRTPVEPTSWGVIKAMYR